ncbi:phosphoribosyltransferase family protein [Klebsiella aerogenes]
MTDSVKIYNCGTYHPYRYRGALNPKAGDSLSRSMMDLKDPKNGNYNAAIQSFSTLIIKELPRFRYRFGNAGSWTKHIDVPFEVVVIPSHEKGKISKALEAIAKNICRHYANGTFSQSLMRNVTVESAHKGGDRSVENHMNTISVISKVSGKVIVLIDDVTTTGGSMTACVNLLKSKGAKVVLPLALLETASYEE